MDENKFLEDAVTEVTSMLLKKKEIWTAGQGPFQNFDIHKDLDINPVQFALTMCNLKMNRIRSSWIRTRNDHDGFCMDKDAEDSVIDLASYAILALALVRRGQESIMIERIVDGIMDDETV